MLEGEWVRGARGREQALEGVVGDGDVEGEVGFEGKLVQDEFELVD